MESPAPHAVAARVLLSLRSLSVPKLPDLTARRASCCRVAARAAHESDMTTGQQDISLKEYQVSVLLSGTIRNPLFLRILESVGEKTLRTFSTRDFMSLDVAESGDRMPADLRPHAHRLVQAGVLESVGRGAAVRYVLSPSGASPTITSPPRSCASASGTATATRAIAPAGICASASLSSAPKALSSTACSSPGGPTCCGPATPGPTPAPRTTPAARMCANPYQLRVNAYRVLAHPRTRWGGPLRPAPGRARRHRRPAAGARGEGAGVSSQPPPTSTSRWPSAH